MIQLLNIEVINEVLALKSKYMFPNHIIYSPIIFYILVFFVWPGKISSISSLVAFKIFHSVNSLMQSTFKVALLSLHYFDWALKGFGIGIGLGLGLQSGLGSDLGLILLLDSFGRCSQFLATVAFASLMRARISALIKKEEVLLEVVCQEMMWAPYPLAPGNNLNECLGTLYTTTSDPISFLVTELFLKFLFCFVCFHTWKIHWYHQLSPNLFVWTVLVLLKMFE